MEKEGKQWISVDEYATSRGKTIQAVHQQRKRKRYKPLLKGHERTERRKIFLDEEAVKILDSAHDDTVAIVDTNTKEKIKKLERTIEQLKNRENNLLNDLNARNSTIIELQTKIQDQTEKIAQTTLENQKKTMLLEQKEDQAAKVDKLITENAELKAKIELLEKSNDQLSAKVASQSVSESQNEPKKGFFARLFGK
jgi:chromosome segregation ATPase